MKKPVAERYRDIDFSKARRGPVVRPEPGKTKISIRLDNTVLDYFRELVEKAVVGLRHGWPRSAVAQGASCRLLW